MTRTGSITQRVGKPECPVIEPEAGGGVGRLISPELIKGKSIKTIRRRIEGRKRIEGRTRAGY